MDNTETLTDIEKLAAKAKALPMGWQRKAATMTGIANNRISDILSGRTPVSEKQIEKLKSAIDELAEESILILSQP